MADELNADEPGVLRARLSRALRGPASLRGALPRRVRLRLWVTGRTDRAAIWLAGHGHCGAAILLWRVCRMW